jgi:uncharacterized protein with PIN domain
MRIPLIVAMQASPRKKTLRTAPDQEDAMLPHLSESDKPPDEMALLADAMLGKLAKWLRLLGYDTAYDPGWDDATIVRLSRAQSRVVLTRDRQLAKRRGLRALFVSGDTLAEQMAQVLEELHLPPAQAGTRCSVCNTLLEPMEKEEVASRVPPFVYDTQQVFHRCPSCDRIYWPGGHWSRMQPVLARLRGEPHGT